MVFVEEAIGLADRGGEIREVFEDVDGYEAVEGAFGEGEGLLAIADDGLHAREHAPDIGGHVFPEFVSVVMGFLVGREFLVVDVLAEAGADFEGGLETGAGIFDRERVVEAFDQAVAIGQNFMPQFHELVAALLLLGCKDWEDFGPLGGLHKK